MKPIKTLLLALALSLSLSAPAFSLELQPNTYVYSNPNLKFNNTELESSLKAISAAHPDLKIQFYSINDIEGTSPEVTRARDYQDYLRTNLGSAFGSNYATLVFVQGTIPTKGTFSVDIGSSYRDVLNQDIIKSEIVAPLIKKYLPQDPQGFIKEVATQLPILIESKRQAIAARVFLLNLGLGFCVVLILSGGIYFLIVYLRKKWDFMDYDFTTIETLKDDVIKTYSGLLQNSIFPKYTGQTAIRVEALTSNLLALQEDFNYVTDYVVKTPVATLKSTWNTYSSKIKSLSSKLVDLKEEQEFLFNLEVELNKYNLNSSDPITAIANLKAARIKEEKEARRIENLHKNASNLKRNLQSYLEKGYFKNEYFTLEDFQRAESIAYQATYSDLEEYYTSLEAAYKPLNLYYTALDSFKSLKTNIKCKLKDLEVKEPYKSQLDKAKDFSKYNLGLLKELYEEVARQLLMARKAQEKKETYKAKIKKQSKSRQSQLNVYLESGNYSEIDRCISDYDREARRSSNSSSDFWSSSPSSSSSSSDSSSSWSSSSNDSSWSSSSSDSSWGSSGSDSSYDSSSSDSSW